MVLFTTFGILLLTGYSKHSSVSVCLIVCILNLISLNIGFMSLLKSLLFIVIYWIQIQIMLQAQSSLFYIL